MHEMQISQEKQLARSLAGPKPIRGYLRTEGVRNRGGPKKNRRGPVLRNRGPEQENKGPNKKLRSGTGKQGSGGQGSEDDVRRKQSDVGRSIGVDWTRSGSEVWLTEVDQNSSAQNRGSGEKHSQVDCGYL
jgi:hypothetical protein